MDFVGVNFIYRHLILQKRLLGPEPIKLNQTNSSLRLKISLMIGPGNVLRSYMTLFTSVKTVKASKCKQVNDGTQFM